jgi:hypothetical protein
MLLGVSADVSDCQCFLTRIAGPPEQGAVILVLIVSLNSGACVL